MSIPEAALSKALLTLGEERRGFRDFLRDLVSVWGSAAGPVYSTGNRAWVSFLGYHRGPGRRRSAVDRVGGAHCRPARTKANLLEICRGVRDSLGSVQEAKDWIDQHLVLPVSQADQTQIAENPANCLSFDAVKGLLLLASESTEGLQRIAACVVDRTPLETEVDKLMSQPFRCDRRRDKPKARHSRETIAPEIVKRLRDRRITSTPESVRKALTGWDLKNAEPQEYQGHDCWIIRAKRNRKREPKGRLVTLG